jgi:hypothetical protein
MDSEETLCPICYDNLDSQKNIVELCCGHKFHYNCVLMVFKNNIHQYPYNSNKIRKCPFCRMDGGYLPLIYPQVPLQFINLEYNELETYRQNHDFEAIEKYFDKTRCHTILKSGRNKGCQCSRKQLINSKFCKQHVPKTE